MKRTLPKQKGHVFSKGKKNKKWYLRYREDVMDEDGLVHRIQKCHLLAPVAGITRSREAAEALAREFLEPLNDGSRTPHSSMSLNRFIELTYMPYIEEQKEPSTVRGYRNLWKRYIEPRGEDALRDLRTYEIELMLRDIHREHKLTKRTLQHIKHFLGGVFRYACRTGVLRGWNPARDAEIPAGRESAETYALSIDEIFAYLSVLPEPAATVVAAAAFTGVREGELRGLRWEDYGKNVLRVTRKVWRGHVGSPKRGSRGDIPVIDILAKYLDRHSIACGDPASGYIFSNSRNKPMCLDKLTRDVIRPALGKAGLKWHGWHAFRRGLATNLHHLKVQDKTIQRILRHANISTTMNIYVKALTPDTISAMKRIGKDYSRVSLQGAETIM